MRYVVELEHGVWLTGPGDLDRTLVLEHAATFGLKIVAARALSRARKERPFRSGRVVPIRFVEAME